MMLQFIIWMIFVYIAAKIIGQLIRIIRSMLTPNKDVMHRNTPTSFRGRKNIEDIPYEEIKDK